MGKILFWVLIIVCVLFVARLIAYQSTRRTRQTPARSADAGGPPMPSPPAGEPMVRCAHCGIHLPRSEALLTQGQTWCDAEHARLGIKP